MSAWLRRNAGVAALVISILGVVMSTTGLADAAKKALFGASTKPKPYGLLLLGRNGKFPASAIPTVSNATNASKLSGKSAAALVASCPAATRPQASARLPLMFVYSPAGSGAGRTS